jgi:O-antigen ligase
MTKKIFNKKILFTYFFGQFNFPYLFTRINTLKNIFSHDGSLNYRMELNKHALSLIQKNLLFGVGLDLTPYYLAKNFKTVDSPLVIFDQAPAHNLVIQLLSETGLLGFLCFSLFIFLALKKNQLNKSNFFLPSLAYLMAAQFHPVFTNHYELTSFFFLYLGLGMQND